MRSWSTMGYILIAFACAISLWFYVADYDRIIEKEILNVPVELVLPPNENLSVESGLGNYINVKVSGKKADVMDMTAGDLRAYIDASGVNEETNRTFDVQVDVLRNGVSVVNSRDIPKVTVVLVEPVYKDFPIKPVIKHSIDEPNFIKTSCVPSCVKIMGSASIINSIVTAEVSEDVGEIDGDCSVWGKIVLKDADGNIVPQTYLDLDETDAKIYIDVFTKKELDVEVLFTGGVYDVNTSGAEIRCNPSSVTVVGPLKTLQAKDTVSVEIDEKLISDSDYSCTVELPNLSKYVNVEYVDGLESVEVSITHSLITSTVLNVNKDDVTFTNDNKFEVVVSGVRVNDSEYADSAQIMFLGLRESINKLPQQSLELSVDLEAVLESHEGTFEEGAVVEIIDVPVEKPYTSLEGVFTKDNIYITIEVTYNPFAESSEESLGELSIDAVEVSEFES
ncbi:MAG: hypothetical protein IJB65_04940 [Clostridia bacterium]|nr:hypothetical protein [Clostridia bacterium]